MSKVLIKKRGVKIENFRNIFTPDEQLQEQNHDNKLQNGNRLILNHNNKEGGVVLLIGPIIQENQIYLMRFNLNLRT